jgi:FlaA1/EpsC-like NDP-sugar epimerase
VIYGAGEGGFVAVRELLKDAAENYRMIGFVDDDQATHRSRVQGYSVLGDYDTLVSLIQAGAVDAIVIGTRMMDVTRLRELEQLCLEHRVRLARLYVDLRPLVAAS